MIGDSDELALDIAMKTYKVLQPYDKELALLEKLVNFDDKTNLVFSWGFYFAWNLLYFILALFQLPIGSWILIFYGIYKILTIKFTSIMHSITKQLMPFASQTNPQIPLNNFCAFFGILISRIYDLINPKRIFQPESLFQIASTYCILLSIYIITQGTGDILFMWILLNLIYFSPFLYRRKIGFQLLHYPKRLECFVVKSIKMEAQKPISSSSQTENNDTTQVPTPN